MGRKQQPHTWAGREWGKDPRAPFATAWEEAQVRLPPSGLVSRILVTGYPGLGGEAVGVWFYERQSCLG